MKKIETKLKDCYILEPDRFGDERGYYSPFFIEEKNILADLGLHSIVQGARSLSGKGIVRGLHFQDDPYCQAKLVECLSGAVLDVVVDLRKDSPTYKEWISVELTPENGRQLLVPRGFAHGFVSLKENTLFQYLVDSDYRPGHENGILWNDPELNIDWQFEKYGIENPILSPKDMVRKTLAEVDPNFYMHKRYLVTGATGQLGYDVVRELNKRGIYDILALGSQDMDITDARIVNKIINDYKPEYIFHCAAYTNVDQAEVDQETAYKVNVQGTKNIAIAAMQIDAKLIYVSTDYVFDGKWEALYYTALDMTNPLNVYGKTKLLGEKEALKNDKTFVVRTSCVFGIHGNNFVKTILKLAETHDTLKVVDDQVEMPTYTVDLARLLVDMSESEKYGIYHATNTGLAFSRASFAASILEGTDTTIVPVTTEEYYRPQHEKAKEEGRELHIAERPKSSVLSDNEKLMANGFAPLPDWQDALLRFRTELESIKRLEEEQIRLKKKS